MPTLIVNKNPGSGDVVLSWSTTTSPYAAVRTTNPDFFGAVTAQIVASGLAGTSYSDPVLANGINYFYSLEDANAPTQVYEMSVLAGLPGDPVTLTGVGFDTSALSANEVFVTGVQAVVTGVTPTSLTFTIPTAALSGSVIASSVHGADGGRSILTVATSGLANASTVAVDAAHTPFVADLGTSATSDRVFTFDPTTGVRTQVGTLNEPIGLSTDTATPNFVYYGNSIADTTNFGTIRRTDSSGADADFGKCGDPTAMPVENCWVWAVGLDPDLTDFGAQGRVYVADRNHNNVKIAKPIGSPDSPFAVFVASPGNLLSAPRGIVVDRNATSSFYHDVFVSTSNAVRRYSSAVPGVLEQTYDSTNSPISNPGQMAIIPSSAASAAGERLLIADRGQNRVVMINPVTNKTKMISVPLNSPRGIALDQDGAGRNFAYVAEATRVVKFPVYKTVYVVPWIAEGAPIDSQHVRSQLELSRRAFESCGIEIRIRDEVVKSFPAGGLLDLEITDWTIDANNCTNPDLARSTEEAALLHNTRSGDQSDLNIYFVRSFTGPAGSQTVAETVTADCFSDVPDNLESGIIVSAGQLRANPNDTMRTVAHEIGHALLDRLSWASGDEHKDPGGTFYVDPNVMSIVGQRTRRGFDDPQCGNINQDLTTQIFRGDP